MKPLARATLVALCIVSSGVPIAGALAQAAPGLRPDARVRVNHPLVPRCARIGRVIAVERDSVRVETPYPDVDRSTSQAPKCSERVQTVVPLRNVEVSLGVERRGLRAVRTGLLVGAAAGAVLGYMGGDDHPNAWFSRSELAIVAASLGGGTGSVLGGLVGLVTWSERWAPASAWSVSTIPHPVNRRVGLAASFAF